MTSFKLIKEGEGDIPAFGKDFTDDEALAVAAYIRSLTFAAPPAAPTVVPATRDILSTLTVELRQPKERLLPKAVRPASG